MYRGIGCFRKKRPEWEWRVLDRILKMRDFRLTPHISLDRNYIDLPVIDGVLRCVMFGAGEHMPALSCCNVLLREEIPARAQGFDLHKDGDIAFFRDDIDFPVRRPGVARQDGIAPFRQVCGYRLLAPFAEALPVPGHFRNSSRTAIRRSSKLFLSGLVLCLSRV